MGSEELADTYGGGSSHKANKVSPSGVKQLGTCEKVESETTQGTFHSPSFHINTSPKFHVANIQNLLTKKELKRKGIFIKDRKNKIPERNVQGGKAIFLGFRQNLVK